MQALNLKPTNSLIDCEWRDVRDAKKDVLEIMENTIYWLCTYSSKYWNIRRNVSLPSMFGYR